MHSCSSDFSLVQYHFTCSGKGLIKSKIISSGIQAVQVQPDLFEFRKPWLRAPSLTEGGGELGRRIFFSNSLEELKVW